MGKEPVKVSAFSWIGTFIILAIPFVNVIYVLLKLLGVGPQAKVSFFRAWFILDFTVIFVFLLILLIRCDFDFKLLLDNIKNIYFRFGNSLGA